MTTPLEIIAPARLHLGFIDLREDAPRRFGSVGIALQEPFYRIALRPAQELKVIAEDPRPVQTLVEKFDNAYGLSSRCELEVLQSIPEHFGLGSGTQLALATGHLLAKLHHLQLSSAEIAATLQRGKRSGIGVGAFDYGGFIVDGGKSASEQQAVPPVIARIPFPEQWRIVLIFDRSGIRGLHGSDEQDTFNNLSKTPAPSADALSYIVMMRILPALLEQDYQQFCESLGDLQEIIGDYFAHLQGGRYRSDTVAHILQELIRSGIRGLGQSSWGPTAYVIARSAQHAEEIQSHIEDTLRTSQGDSAPIDVVITTAKE